jgi:hypothetical protein
MSRISSLLKSAAGGERPRTKRKTLALPAQDKLYRSAEGLHS